MKKTFLTLAASIAAFSMYAQENPLEVQQFELSNGMKVWVNRDSSQPFVYGAVVVRAGGKDCPDTGIAHYLEHLLFKGTEELGTTDYDSEKVWLDSISLCYDRLSATKDQQKRDEIQKEIGRLSQRAAEYAIPNEFSRLTAKYGGTDLNAGTSYDYTYYHNYFSPQYIEQWAELNSHRLIHPVFRLFQGELEAVYEEKNRSADNALQTPLFEMIKEFSGNNPYSYQIIGSTENLKNPRLGEMKAFFDRYYVGCNMGIVLCGDIDTVGLHPLLERTFGRIRRGEEPDRAQVDVTPFTEARNVKIKAKIPLVKISVYAFNGPTDSEEDAPAFDLAMGLLTNSFSSGLMDSLITDHKLLFGAASRVPLFNEMGIAGFAVVPNLPFGSRSKAEQLCWEQIRKVQRGDFSDSVVDALKLEASRSAEKTLESIEGRSDQMVTVMAQGRDWKDYLAQVESIRSITREDIVRVANKYLTDKYIRFVKVMGSYPKDNIAKPDLEPVVPVHADAVSAYAKKLETIPVRTFSPRLIDLEEDVERGEVTPGVKLYYKENPVNDLFNLTLRIEKGTADDPAIEQVALFMNGVGTDSLSIQQFSKAWQELGTTFAIESGRHTFDIMLCGYEDNLDESLRLLRHFIDHAKPDKDSFRERLTDIRLMKRTFFTTGPENVMQALLDRVRYGDQSSYLSHLDTKSLNTIGMNGLMARFSELMDHEYTVLYSGRKPAGKVAASLQKELDLGRAVKAGRWELIKMNRYDKPTVFFFNLPGSRQTMVTTYQTFDNPVSGKDRATSKLLGEYLGGSMFSPIFQEVREFRSLAYVAQAASSTSLPLFPSEPGALYTVFGTQADKSLSALHLVDSLLREFPVKENNLESARNAILAKANNDYPTFRELPAVVSEYERQGYDADPDKVILDNLSDIDAETLQSYYEQAVKPAPLVYIIVGDRKALPVEELSKYGEVVELKKKDIYK